MEREGEREEKLRDNHMICGLTVLPHILALCAKKKRVQRHKPPTLFSLPGLGIWHHSGENKSPTSPAPASVVCRAFMSFSCTRPHVHTEAKKHFLTVHATRPLLSLQLTILESQMKTVGVGKVCFPEQTVTFCGSFLWILNWIWMALRNFKVVHNYKHWENNHF